MLRARVPEANVVRTNAGETENYLFYRGVGNFTPGLRTTVSTDETLLLENLTDGDIPYLLVFQQKGSRVFWVLPAAMTERILPLSVTPPPAKTVRVLVGRSEVLRPRQEAGWLAASRMTGDAALTWRHTVDSDRFGLAIEERVNALNHLVTVPAVSR